MTYQLLAVLGSIAHGIRSFIGAILGLLGLGRFAGLAVPLLIGVLAVAAVLSARDTATILGSRPTVTEATLPEVAAHTDDTGGSVWYAFDALIALDSFPSPTEAGTFFYLALDPEDRGRGLLVRSPLNDAFFRQRVLSADIVEDADAIATALDAFGTLPAGLEVDRVRLLDETAAGGDIAEAFVPSQLADEAAGENLLVTGRVVSPGSFGACGEPAGCEADGSRYLYLFADADGGDAFVLRSAHPPSAIPVRLEGLYLRDTFDLRPVLDSEWFRSIDAEVPTARAFNANTRPPITVEASWIPTIAFAALALLLLASHLAGYPVFGAARRQPEPSHSLGVGEAVDVAISGRLARDHATLQLERSPGALERLPIPDLALRMWRYGLLSPELSRQEAERRFVEEAGASGNRLVVHERDQSALVVLGRGSGASVQGGRLHRLGRSVPAVHVRHARTIAYLELRITAERDRVAAEILAVVGEPGD
jgi:hypothetical protein